MPKVELHVHLEGAIAPATLLRLARRRGVVLPADTEAGIRRWFEVDGFERFVEVYLAVSRCLRDPEDFQMAVRDFLAERATQNIVYSEVYLTVSTHAANGANVDEVADALAETVAGGERDLGISVRWIPDIVRNVDYSWADRTLEWALEHRGRYVVGLGLAGKESYPASPFREHFRVAAAEGLGTVVHAGEQEGAASVREALEVCSPRRIGHGFRSVEDGDLVAELVEAQLPLELCPTSNLKLGLVDEMTSHPLRSLARAGARWSVATDDPEFFGCDLAGELLASGTLAGLGGAGLAALTLDAAADAFAADDERAALRERLLAGFAEVGLDSRDILSV